MTNLETSLGGRNGAFPETAWSSILSRRDLSSPERAASINRLFSLYWRPVYASIRTLWKKPVDEAKDLTQAFFLHLLEWDFVAGYQPDRGRFRGFLKGALRNFLAQTHRAESRQKRGGDATILSLDVESFERERGPADETQVPPDQVFDRQWSREVLTQALVQLHRECEAQGRPLAYRAYLRYYFGGGDQPSYDALAKELGITAAALTQLLHDARRRFKEILRERVSEYVISEEELQAELRELFAP